MSVLGIHFRCWLLAAIICVAGVLPSLAAEQFCRTKSPNRVRTARVVRLDDHDLDHWLDGAAALAFEASEYGWADSPSADLPETAARFEQTLLTATAAGTYDSPDHSGSHLRSARQLRAPPSVLS